MIRNHTCLTCFTELLWDERVQIGLHIKSALKIRRSWEVKIIHILYYWQVSSYFILKSIHLEWIGTRWVTFCGKWWQISENIFLFLVQHVFWTASGEAITQNESNTKGFLVSFCTCFGPVPCLSQINIIPQPFVLRQDPRETGEAPIPAMPFSRGQWDGLDTCVLRALLVSWGFCKNYHKPGDLKPQKFTQGHTPSGGSRGESFLASACFW